jgi:hypothetical protein
MQTQWQLEEHILERDSFLCLCVQCHTEVIFSSKNTFFFRFREVFSLILLLSNSVALELKGLSPHSQEPATGSYPEPVESTTHPANLPKIHSDPIFPSTFRSSEWSLLGFPTHTPFTFSYPLLCVPHAPPSSFSTT